MDKPFKYYLLPAQWDIAVKVYGLEWVEANCIKAPLKIPEK